MCDVFICFAVVLEEETADKNILRHSAFEVIDQKFAQN